ncbi:hypothetical protein L6R52_33265, partial [Myxococcota bacterium]|nr:hypothetical protein [Myxococcota bacterium]
EVRAARGVELASIEGQTARPVRGGLSIALGTLASAELRAIELALRGRCDAAGRVELARVQVRYRDWSDAGRINVRDEAIALPCVDDASRFEGGLDARVELEPDPASE